MATYTGSKQSQQIPQDGKIQNGDPRNDPDLQTDRGVGDFHRLQGCLLPYIDSNSVKEISHISCTGQSIPIQSTSIWSGHSPTRVHYCKEVKLMALQRGIRIQYLDDWLVRATSHQICLQHTQTLVALCQELGWLVNMEKSELDPKQVFYFVGYQFDLQEGKVRPTLDQWRILTTKIRDLLTGSTCPVRQLMSLIGLLTTTEKQLHLGHLHMRPIQWHLKNNWRVPESLEKVIPVPKSLHPHLKWRLEESNVSQGQPLHPLKHALQLFTDASKEGWGAHLNDHTTREPGPYQKANYISTTWN